MQQSFLKIFLILTLICLVNIQASAFTMQHKNCDAEIRILAEGFEKESRKEMLKIARREAKERQYKIRETAKSEESSKGNKVLPDQLYFYIKLSRKGFLYKKCQAITQLKMSENYRISEDDETLYEGKSNRQFPRITFKGDERCTRAIQDTFVHIPTCKTP